MAKGYWVVRVSVHDQQRYPDYLAAAKPAFEKFGANFIVRGGAFDSMEDTSRDRNVVVESSRTSLSRRRAIKAPNIRPRRRSARNIPRPTSLSSKADWRHDSAGTPRPGAALG